VPGKPGEDLGIGTLNSVWKSGAQEMRMYLSVVEKTGTGYSAYSPDLDGCVATGRTREEVESEMQEAIAFHLEGMAQSGEPIPEPRTYSGYVEVPARAR
jgi:predicted RNase H-like HicB family nuclease